MTITKQEIGVFFAVGLIGAGAWWYGSKSRQTVMGAMSAVPNVETVNAGDVVPTMQTSNVPNSDNDWSDVPDYLKVAYPGMRDDSGNVVPSTVIWSMSDAFGPQSIPPQL